MFKTFLSFLALAVLVDAIAFGGFYRAQTLGESAVIGHAVYSLDWKISH